MVEIDPRANDETVLERALGEERILLTEDTDFGELVVVKGLPHPTIVRLVELDANAQVSAMKDLIASGVLEARGLVVVTASRVRVRPSTSPP